MRGIEVYTMPSAQGYLSMANACIIITCVISDNILMPFQVVIQLVKKSGVNEPLTNSPPEFPMKTKLKIFPSYSISIALCTFMVENTAAKEKTGFKATGEKHILLCRLLWE